MTKLVILSNKKNDEREFEKAEDYFLKALNQEESIKDLEKEMNRLQQTLDEDIEEGLEEELEEENKEEPIEISDKKVEDEANKYLNNKASIDILNSYKLKLPSKYKVKSMTDFQRAFKKGMDVKGKLKEKIKNFAKYEVDSDAGILRASYKPPKKGSKANSTSLKLINEHNTMAIFEANMRGLRSYKNMTGQGIIHFNNPHLLIDRLESLAGSIFAGNNGVKQEFS